MVDDGEIGPVGPPRSPAPFSSQPKKDIQHHAEKIHSMIGYAAKEPKSFEKTFLNIAILMHFEEKNILTPDEHRHLAEELRSLGESIHDGSVRINDLEEALEKMVEDAKYRNPKAKILAGIIELEHLITIHPPHGEPTSFDAFQKVLYPLLQLIEKDLKRIQTTAIFKELETVKHEILNSDVHPGQALDHLKASIDHLLRSV